MCTGHDVHIALYPCDVTSLIQVFSLHWQKMREKELNRITSYRMDVGGS